jgi:hypothetical protein
MASAHDASTGKLDIEHISSLIDGELDAEQAAAVIDALCKDPGLQRRWSDLQLVGDALRSNETAACHVAGFGDRVRAALADEPTVLAPPRARSPAPSLHRADCSDCGLGCRDRIHRRAAIEISRAAGGGAACGSDDAGGRARRRHTAAKGSCGDRQCAGARSVFRCAPRTDRRHGAAAGSCLPASERRRALMPAVLEGEGAVAAPC